MSQRVELYMPQEKPVPFRYPRSLFSRLAGVVVLWLSWASGVVGAILGAAMIASYNVRGFGIVVLFGAAFVSLRMLGQHMRGFRDLRHVQSKSIPAATQPQDAPFQQTLVQSAQN